jgi:hypothetical protein
MKMVRLLRSGCIQSISCSAISFVSYSSSDASNCNSMKWRYLIFLLVDLGRTCLRIWRLRLTLSWLTLAATVRAPRLPRALILSAPVLDRSTMG